MRRGRAVLALLTAVLAGAGLLAACSGDDGMSSGGGSGSSGTSSSRVAVFHEADTSISVKAGERFVLALPANPTTGYSWKAIVSDPTVVQATGSKQVTPKGAGIGAGGTQRLSFTALAKGTSTLELVYDRPFAQGSPGNKTISYTVTVS
jgi:inhibitor of cysteine peptidase